MEDRNFLANKFNKILIEIGIYTVITLVYLFVLYFTNNILIDIFRGKNVAYVPNSEERIKIIIILCVVITFFVGILQKNDIFEKQLYPLFICAFLLCIFIPEGIIMEIIKFKRHWFNIYEIIIPFFFGECFWYYKKVKYNLK